MTIESLVRRPNHSTKPLSHHLSLCKVQITRVNVLIMAYDNGLRYGCDYNGRLIRPCDITMTMSDHEGHYICLNISRWSFSNGKYTRYWLQCNRVYIKLESVSVRVSVFVSVYFFVPYARP